MLLGRALTDPSEEVVTVMGEIFSESANLFFTLLKKAAPNINHSEFYWRANCVVGAFTFAESYTDRLTRFIDEDLSDIDWRPRLTTSCAFSRPACVRRPRRLPTAPARGARDPGPGPPDLI